MQRKIRAEQLPLEIVYVEGILFLIFRNYQRGEQQKGNALHHRQPPILLMRQIYKRSHLADRTSHFRPMLRLRVSSLSWVSFHLSTKHVLWTNGSIPWNVSPFTKVLRKQCAAFPDEESAGNKSVDPACSLHLDGWAAMRSVPRTFSREEQCA